MLRFGSSFINGVQNLAFIHGFHQITLYSTSISTEVNPNLINYLVQNLGFSKKQALSTSSKVTNYRIGRRMKTIINSNFVNNAGIVIAFLEKIGLEKVQIRNVVVLEPRILVAKVNKTLIPKIENFQKLGFSKADIVDFISVNPYILLRSWGPNAISVIQALKDVMGSNDYVISFLKKLWHVHFAEIPICLMPNVALLLTYGIPIDSIRKFVIKEPSAFLRKAEYFQDAVIKVEENWDIDRTSPRFLAGVVVLSATTEKTIETKKQVYKSFGWSDSDVISIVMSCPALLALSEDTIKKKLDFLMNELGYEPRELASKCTLLTCSLERRAVRRHKVLVVLKEKGYIRKDYALNTAIMYTEPKFVKKFVLPFKEVQEVYAKLAGISLEMLNLRFLQRKS